MGVLSVCEKTVLDPVSLTAWLPMRGLRCGQKRGGGSRLWCLLCKHYQICPFFQDLESLQKNPSTGAETSISCGMGC